MKTDLSKPSNITAFRGGKSQPERIDRKGGDYGAGVIYGASVITYGEARGHGAWIDKEFVSSVNQAILDSGTNGIKARFDHPSMSGDNVGKFLGRTKNARLSEDGTQVFADFHFAQSAHSAPSGDLAGYVMDLAEEDPQGIAISIAFEQDREASYRFSEAHRNDKGFKSPDPNNTNNYEHVRLKKLRAADVVDEPAANPNGMFHYGNQTDIEEVMQTVFGALTNPEMLRGLSDASFNGISLSRASEAFQRYLASNNLMIQQMQTGATTEPNKGSEQTAPPAAAFSAQDAADLAQFRAEKAAAEKQAELNKIQADLDSKYAAKFDSLEKQVADLKGGKQFSTGEETPVVPTPADDKQELSAADQWQAKYDAAVTNVKFESDSERISATRQFITTNGNKPQSN